MRVLAINNQSFGANKFRLPIESIDYSLSTPGLFGKQKIKGTLYKEFSNPNAKELYELAQKATDLREKARLYLEMGDCTIIDTRNTYKAFKKSQNEYIYGKGISGFIRKICNIVKPL